MNPKTPQDYKEFFKGKSIMITGGLGFIGSNLARRLVEIEPGRVILVDALIREQGGNLYNIQGIEDSVEIPHLERGGLDVRNREVMLRQLQGVDCAFNLAGSVSHIDSKNRPLTDLDMNLGSSVAFLEVCREYLQAQKNKPKFKIVFSATRDIYGKTSAEDLPVKEDFRVRESADPQGIHKHAAEFHHLWYARNFGFNAASLRLTNTYGPRQQVKDAEHGFLNWFIRQAIEDKELQLWGGGQALRDFNYVDDVVEALLMTMASESTNNGVFNLGCFIRRDGRYSDVTESVASVGEVAKKVVAIAATGRIRDIPYPEDKRGIEPGHVYLDATKIFETLGWQPKIGLYRGIGRTIDFYRRNREHYLI